MKKYSEEINKAYNSWMDKLDKEVDVEWHPKYKSSRRNSKRAGDKFEAACKAEGLDYIDVATDIAAEYWRLTYTKDFLNKVKEF